MDSKPYWALVKGHVSPLRSKVCGQIMKVWKCMVGKIQFQLFIITKKSRKAMFGGVQLPKELSLGFQSQKFKCYIGQVHTHQGT